MGKIKTNCNVLSYITYLNYSNDKNYCLFNLDSLVVMTVRYKMFVAVQSCLIKIEFYESIGVIINLLSNHVTCHMWNSTI